MNRSRRCVYAGSFDPVTRGHLYLIEQGSQMFEELIVAVGSNPTKRYTFSLDERLAFLRGCTAHLANVRIDQFAREFLVHYAQRMQAGYLLRGMRSAADYEFERTMRYVNGDLDAGITSVFLMPPRELAEVSSSFVKGLVGPDGWEPVVQRYVPDPVFAAFVRMWGDGKAAPPDGASLVSRPGS